MNNHPSFDTMDVVGTTTVLPDLPKRLSPVYASRVEGGTYYVTINEPDIGGPALSQETAAHFDALVAQGDAIRFERPIAAREGHCLVQVEQDAPPEYLPVDDLPNRLFRAQREALERASRALSTGDRDNAEALAWYARRANGDDPLPVLLLISLLRGVVAQEELSYLEQDLDDYSARQIDSARRRAHEHAELRMIGETLDEPPNSGVRLTYLAPFQSIPGFLGKARRLTNAPARRSKFA